MKKTYLVIMLVVVFILVGCSPKNQSSLNDNNNYKQMYETLLEQQPPFIKEIIFKTLDGKIINKKDNWFNVGKKVKIVIVLDGNCTQVDLFITPTGTETYTMQKMIGTAVPKNNIAEYMWDVPDGTLAHFNIMAYNGDVSRRSELYNIIR